MENKWRPHTERTGDMNFPGRIKQLMREDERMSFEQAGKLAKKELRKKLIKQLILETPMELEEFDSSVIIWNREDKKYEREPISAQGITRENLRKRKEEILKKVELILGKDE